jgi:hypothetical protein
MTAPQSAPFLAKFVEVSAKYFRVRAACAAPTMGRQSPVLVIALHCGVRFTQPGFPRGGVGLKYLFVLRSAALYACRHIRASFHRSIEVFKQAGIIEANEVLWGSGWKERDTRGGKVVRRNSGKNTGRFLAAVTFRDCTEQLGSPPFAVPTLLRAKSGRRRWPCATFEFIRHGTTPPQS